MLDPERLVSYKGSFLEADPKDVQSKQMNEWEQSKNKPSVFFKKSVKTWDSKQYPHKDLKPEVKRTLMRFGYKI